MSSDQTYAKMVLVEVERKELRINRQDFAFVEHRARGKGKK